METNLKRAGHFFMNKIFVGACTVNINLHCLTLTAIEAHD